MRKKLTDYFERSEEGHILGMTVPVLKPEGWSSFDVVRKLRSLTTFRKVGHAGTLDPFATGVLVLGFGRHTKTLDRFKAEKKEYLLQVLFGLETDSYDITGKVLRSEEDSGSVRTDLLQAALSQFIGDIQQLPPMYSAKKVKGTPLYRHARAGRTVERQTSAVRIESIEIENYVHPRLDLRVVCGPGTYMRTLAHELGRSLDMPACASALHREAVGGMKTEDAFTIEEFTEQWRLSAA